jgi:hypothetical protein
MLKAFKFNLFKAGAAWSGNFMSGMDILSLSVQGRRSWSAFSYRFATGKAWGFVVMLMGFCFGSHLEQPALHELDELEEGENILAVRKWTFSVNYLQKPSEPHEVSHIN